MVGNWPSDWPPRSIGLGPRTSRQLAPLLSRLCSIESSAARQRAISFGAVERQVGHPRTAVGARPNRGSLNPTYHLKNRHPRTAAGRVKKIIPKFSTENPSMRSHAVAGAGQAEELNPPSPCDCLSARPTCRVLAARLGMRPEPAHDQPSSERTRLDREVERVSDLLHRPHGARVETGHPPLEHAHDRSPSLQSMRIFAHLFARISSAWRAGRAARVHASGAAALPSAGTSASSSARRCTSCAAASSLLRLLRAVATMRAGEAPPLIGDAFPSPKLSETRASGEAPRPRPRRLSFALY